MQNLLRYLVFTGAVLMVGCDDLTQNEKNSQAIKEGIKNREIKKVSDVDILTKGEQQANSLGLKAETELMTFFARVGQGFKSDSLVILTANQVDSISYKIGQKIRFVSIEQLQEASMDEQQLLEAYVYNLENNLPVKGAIQFINEKQNVLYTHPLVISDKSCPDCLVGQEAALIGMWSIEYTVKEIVGAL